jgi:hypothetical protein
VNRSKLHYRRRSVSEWYITATRCSNIIVLRRSVLIYSLKSSVRKMWSPQFRAAHQTGSRSLNVPPQRTVRHFVAALVSQRNGYEGLQPRCTEPQHRVKTVGGCTEVKRKIRLKIGTGFSVEETYLLAMKIAAGRTRTCRWLRLRIPTLKIFLWVI